MPLLGNQQILLNCYRDAGLTAVLKPLERSGLVTVSIDAADRSSRLTGLDDYGGSRIQKNSAVPFAGLRKIAFAKWIANHRTVG